MSGVQAKTVTVDLGYRGQHNTDAEVIHRGKKLSKRQKRRLRRRSMLEAMIGHMKNDGLMERCHLKGKHGDSWHAILCGIGHNLRLLRAYVVTLLFWLFMPVIGAVTSHYHGAKRIIWAEESNIAPAQ